MTFLDSIEYFDGVSPISHKGILSPDEDSFAVTFEDGQEKLWIEYSAIIRLEDISGSSHIFLRDDLHNSRKIVIKDANTIEIIKKKYYAGRPFLSKTAQAFHLMKTSRLLMVAIVLIPLFSFSVFFVFSQAYTFIPKSYEQRLGEKTMHFISMNSKTCENSPGINSLDRLKKKLTQNPDVRITVLKNDLVNALALPGGRIILFSGLIDQAESPEEIYAVLAH